MDSPPRAGSGSAVLQSRDLLRVAFGPSLVALAVIAAVVLVQLVAANSDLTGTLGAVASMWLAAHQVPVTLAGQQLGVLPLVPPAALIWATARGTVAITTPQTSWYVLRWVIASAIGGPLFFAAIALAVVHDAASVLTVLQTPNALHAFGCVIVVHGLGALLGVGPRIAARETRRFGVPAWVTGAVRPAAVGVATLLALCCAVVAGSLIVHWATMHELFGFSDSFVGQLSLTVLSLLYLPNVVIGTAAVAVGSSASIGFATFSAFTVFGGDIPALPILAAVPTPPLGPVWVALLIVGAAAGVALGQQCALKPLPAGAAFAKLAVAALLAALILALLALLGGGQLGNFGHVGVDQATFAPAAFFWFFAVGALTVVLAGGLSARTGPRDIRLPPEAAGPAEFEPESPEPQSPEPESSEPESSEPQPGPPPPAPPVIPAPDADDVEDLMFVDADIADEPDPGRQPPAGTG